MGALLGEPCRAGATNLPHRVLPHVPTSGWDVGRWGHDRAGGGQHYTAQHRAGANTAPPGATICSSAPRLRCSCACRSQCAPPATWMGARGGGEERLYGAKPSPVLHSVSAGPWDEHLGAGHVRAQRPGAVRAAAHRVLPGAVRGAAGQPGCPAGLPAARQSAQSRPHLPHQPDAGRHPLQPHAAPLDPLLPGRGRLAAAGGRVPPGRGRLLPGDVQRRHLHGAHQRGSAVRGAAGAAAGGAPWGGVGVRRGVAAGPGLRCARPHRPADLSGTCRGHRLLRAARAAAGLRLRHGGFLRRCLPGGAGRLHLHRPLAVQRRRPLAGLAPAAGPRHGAGDAAGVRGVRGPLPPDAGPLGGQSAPHAALWAPGRPGCAARAERGSAQPQQLPRPPRLLLLHPTLPR